MNAVNHRVDLSYTSVIRFFVVVLSLGFLFMIRDIVVVLFVAFLIASGLTPLVGVLARKIPRIVAVILIYSIFIAVLLGFGVLVRSTVLKDVNSLTTQVQEGKFNLSVAGFDINSQAAYEEFSRSLQSQGLSSLITGARKVVSGVASVFLVFVLSFYMLMEKNGLKQALRDFLPLKIYQEVMRLIQKIEIKVGSWMRGELILMVAVGLLTYLMLKIAGVPYAAVLAILAGLTEVIPGVGPIAGGVVGVVITMATFPLAPVRWLVVAIGYFLIQQFENQVLVPQVMKKVLGLSPIVVLVSILVGVQILGVVGALIAVPTAAAISVVIQEWEGSVKKVKRSS